MAWTPILTRLSQPTRPTNQPTTPRPPSAVPTRVPYKLLRTALQPNRVKHINEKHHQPVHHFNSWSIELAHIAKEANIVDIKIKSNPLANTAQLISTIIRPAPLCVSPKHQGMSQHQTTSHASNHRTAT